MNKQSHEHQHSNPHNHDHGGGHKPAHHSPGWKPHRDWRVWAVVLMLVAMAVYVLTMDESLAPGGGGPEIPAAAPPADAP